MKKVLALALASVMALGMATTAFAAPPANGLGTGYTVLGTSGAKTPEASGVIAWNSTYMSTVTYSSDIIPNQRVNDYVNLTQDMFYAAPATAKALLTSQQIRDLKLTIRTSTKGGSQAIDSVALDRKGFVEIKYARELVKTSEVDFELTIYPVLDGRRYDDYSITFIGTLANEITEVYGDYDSVDTSAGQVAEAMEFNNNIEVELGNGVTIHTKFFKGKKYYGTCTRDTDDQDDVVFKKYPDVDNVITLKTVGLNSTGDIVKLDTDYSDYYVYDKDMNYLGQSNQMLPYSTKYYLANRKLDVTDDNDVDEGDAPEESGGNPETGGDGGAASNANANPGTGR